MASGAADMRITNVRVDPEEPRNRQGRTVEFEFTGKNVNQGSGSNYAQGYMELVEGPPSVDDESTIIKSCALVEKGDTFEFDDSTVDGTLDGSLFVPQTATEPLEIRILVGGFNEGDLEFNGCKGISDGGTRTDSRNLEVPITPPANEPPNAVANANRI